MTVKELLGTSELANLDAEVLLAFVQQQPRSRLLAHPEAAIDEDTARRFIALAKRRTKGEPVAYLMGNKEFYGREFAVNQDVLCPRPDTEVLVERALAVARPGDTICDVGTGSGCVGITLALERPDVAVILSDISPEALAVAEQNAARLGAKVDSVLADGFPESAQQIPSKRLVIVANLPYLDVSDPPHPFEPDVALDGGPDGLAVIRAFLTQLEKRSLSPRHLWLEHGESQGTAVRELVGPHAKTYPDLAGHERITGY